MGRLFQEAVNNLGNLEAIQAPMIVKFGSMNTHRPGKKEKENEKKKTKFRIPMMSKTLSTRQSESLWKMQLNESKEKGLYVTLHYVIIILLIMIRKQSNLSKKFIPSTCLRIIVSVF